MAEDVPGGGENSGSESGSSSGSSNSSSSSAARGGSKGRDSAARSSKSRNSSDNGTAQALPPAHPPPSFSAVASAWDAAARDPRFFSLDTCTRQGGTLSSATVKPFDDEEGSDRTAASRPPRPSKLGVTLPFLLASTWAWLSLLFCAAYVILFALTRGTAAGLSLLQAWASCLPFTLLVLPLLWEGVPLLWHFVVLPAAAGWLRRVPFIGDACGAAAVGAYRKVGALPQGVLSARLSACVLTRAAAAAARVPPPLAAAIFLPAASLAELLEAPAYALLASGGPSGTGTEAGGSVPLRAQALRRLYLLKVLAVAPAKLRASASATAEVRGGTDSAAPPRRPRPPRRPSKHPPRKPR